ncbi:MAG: type III pantothenate kinase [Candidatus Reddybacter sp.]
MIVDIDIGNTRAKWRLSSEGSAIEHGVLDARCNEWTALQSLRSYQPERVRVSNVAGGDVAERVRQIAAKAFGLEVEFAVASKAVGEVVSGYEQPERLGVDRWLALLSGWELFRSRCVVVDAGSALTFDFLDEQARHLGGYIIPGRQMMLDSLYGGTSGVRSGASQAVALNYGQNTDSAVHNGCLAMTISLIEKMLSVEGLGMNNLVLTGGDAQSLLVHLPSSVAHVPDLVLDGLALALP